jgi:thioredoxin-dependent peroxiredoxin
MSNRPGMSIGPKEFPVAGSMLNTGDPAPAFRLTANNWSSKTLADYDGKVKILSIVPSLDTRVCSAQTHRFNAEASSLGQEIIVLTISADLPYAQSRWCGAEGVDRVETLSDHKDMNFSTAYGVHVTDLRICQRAAFVVDKNNVVQYVEYVPIIGNEINFSAVLEKARSLV